MASLKPVQVQPIGYIKNELGKRRYNDWYYSDSEIIISEDYHDALYRLDDFSHIEVLFYLHEMDKPFKTRIYPTGNPDYPEMGAFATRTPDRPSKIALTTCRLISIKDNVLHVKGLDAFNGSLVIDIKPYSGENIEGVRVPAWVDDLKENKDKQDRKKGELV